MRVKIFKFIIDIVVVFVQSKAEDAPASKDAVSSVVSRHGQRDVRRHRAHGTASN